MIKTSGGQFYVGVVEDRNDPLKLGRSKVRVAGLHTHDKNVLPTEDLPWAMLMQPINGGTTVSSVAPAEGSSVIVVFADWPENQQPIVVGMLAGIPQGNPVTVDNFEDPPLYKDVITPGGRLVPTSYDEADGGHLGPITAPTSSDATADPANVSAGVALLDYLTQQSVSLMGQDVSNLVFGSIVNPPGLSLGSIGGLTGAVTGLGTKFATTRNALESIIISSGNKDVALQAFMTAASNTGTLGNILTLTLGSASLIEGLTEEFANWLGDDIIGSLSELTTDGLLDNLADAGLDTISGLTSGAASLTDIGEDLAGLGSSLIDQEFTSVADLFGFDGDQLGNVNISNFANMLSEIGTTTLTNIASDISTTVENVAETFGALQLEQTLTSGGTTITTLASLAPSELVAGDSDFYTAVTILDTLPETTPITQKQFEELNIGRGEMPPTKGVYGGPNFGGGKEVAVLKDDSSIYSAARYTSVDAPVEASRALVTTAPLGWKGNRATAEANIKALINACNLYGLTTLEQQATVLGIVGGECNWIPSEESAQYSSVERLCQVFSSSFKGDLDRASEFVNWERGNRGPKSDFFNYVYSPEKNGRQLGNTKPGDGGRFFGRGFIQLTGRSNYERYSQLTGINLVETPSLLLTNVDVSAQVAVAYIKDRVGGVSPNAHPGFFYAALKAVGHNTPDIAARKREYYEHFYGLKTPESFGYQQNTAGPTLSPYSYNGAMLGNEGPGTSNNWGFMDPHKKYPLKRKLNESEISRLARGAATDTVVQVKDSTRTLGVPLPNNAGYWNQPKPPYAAQYPYNHVRETESGHVQEFDDTPGNERIHTYHRSGTFNEIDATGTSVTKVVGDGYVIYDRNGFISISGDANVTVTGNVNVYCRSDANIQVEGSAEMVVGGSFDVRAAKDINLCAGGDFRVYADKSFSIQSKVEGNIVCENFLLTAEGDVDLRSERSIQVYSKLGTDLLVEDALKIKSYSKSEIVMTSSLAEIGESLDMTVGTATKITSMTGFHVKSDSGNIDLDGQILNLNSGTAASARLSSADDVALEADQAVLYGMTAPANGVPVYPRLDPIAPPEFMGEEQYMYEIPEETNNAASAAIIRDYIANEGRSNTLPSETSNATGNTIPTVDLTPEQQSMISSTSNFTSDYKLSKHFTLGMMFDGGFNVKHRLIDQCGLTKSQIVANMASLCENILEKYLDVLPGGIDGYRTKWLITSGYRMQSASGSSSDHPRGRACDIQIVGRNKQQHFDLIKQLDTLVPYDQLILEYAGPHSVWIHTGFRGNENRRMAFTMRDHAKYSNGFVLLG